MMELRIEDFLKLGSTEQIEFLKAGEFRKLSREEMIDFLKSILETELSSKTIASTLKMLRELKFRDQFFFRKFLYHADGSVASAARKAISDAIEQKDSGIIKITEILKKEKGESRMEYLQSLLKDKDDFSTEILISLLNLDDINIREKLIREVDREFRVDEARLAEAIKGSVWYVRAAIVKILSNLNSEYLPNVIDFLMDDKNVEVKLKVVEALSQMDGVQSRPYLERLKKDSLIWVRREAEKALSRGNKTQA